MKIILWILCCLDGIMTYLVLKSRKIQYPKEDWISGELNILVRFFCKKYGVKGVFFAFSIVLVIIIILSFLLNTTWRIIFSIYISFAILWNLRNYCVLKKDRAMEIRIEGRRK